ncbi:hypothetical protein SLEP1_g53338 [Rubroshorea leprosula]|uniref:Amidohydrolase-related domain-containing protein n=1 Tax=Rubroshorea leprosula TaxID=152421 RepID=A0AAV5MBY1_9ROSI|nr:hypothetical protein SLEP1_g53338 [Rubroshorea leprosula]
MEFGELREAIEKMELVDGHAHNIVSVDTTFPFINSFSEATGDALSFTPHSLSFKRNLREISELYGSESSLDAVEEYRRLSGLQAISLKCFKAAGISAVLIDDGLKLDEMHDIEWHRSLVPFAGRILRIERLAEQILDGLHIKVVLDINPNVTTKMLKKVFLKFYVVYLDFGLAVPKLSVHGMISLVKEFLEVAPINKVMISTDGYAVLETYYLGAKKACGVIFSVLCDACIDGDLHVAEATEAAKGIFGRNAIEFYKINAGLKFSDLKASSTPCFDVENAVDTGASFVRSIWVDAPGQYRYRVRFLFLSINKL